MPTVPFLLVTQDDKFLILDTIYISVVVLFLKNQFLFVSFHFLFSSSASTVESWKPHIFH